MAFLNAHIPLYLYPFLNVRLIFQGGHAAVPHNSVDTVLAASSTLLALPLRSQICMICRDEIEIIVDEEPFVACNECAFPICRPCYEYERREGNQACPQCKTRFKRIKGSPRVDGDEEEDQFDDLVNEFDIRSYDRRDRYSFLELSMRHNFSSAASNISCSATPSEMDQAALTPEIPLLTYGQEDDDNHALIIPPYIGRSKRVHPMQCFDAVSSVSGAISYLC